MPLFSNKFIAKTIPPRKVTGREQSQTHADLKFNPGDPISVQLGHFKAYFHGGRWIADGAKEEDSFQNNQLLREKLQDAREEINMLRVKEEILLDMVTDLTIQLEEKGTPGVKSHMKS